MGKGLWVIMVTACAGACGGSNAALRAQTEELQSEVQKLRNAARRDRIRAKDLEKRLTIQAAAAARQRNSDTQQDAFATPRPDLPVVVKEPESLESESDLPADYQVVGVNDEGVEIVYVGEAASGEITKLSPKTYPLDGHPDDRDDVLYAQNQTEHDGARKRPRTGARFVPQVHDSPPFLTDVDDRLPVVHNVPTIESQLRAASPSTIEATTAENNAEDTSFGDPRWEYQRYLGALREGNHAYTVTGFRSFVSRFPKHSLADNAQYWLGEAFYDQKRYQSALLEFRKVVKEHPKGNKVPDALLKEGYCLSHLGQVDEAQAVLQKVLRLYPKSNPAIIAKTKLRELEERLK